MRSGLDRERYRPDNPGSAPVRWQSGDAADCKSAYVGSIPARTSRVFNVLARIGDGHLGVRTPCGPVRHKTWGGSVTKTPLVHVARALPNCRQRAIHRQRHCQRRRPAAVQASDAPPLPQRARWAGQSPCRHTGPPPLGRTQRRKCAPTPYFFFSFFETGPKMVSLCMFEPLPFPLWKVQATPSVARLQAGAFGAFMSLAGHFWAGECRPLPNEQNTLMVLARCDLTRWCRYREPALAALREVEPYLRATHADWRAGHDKKAECAARARAAKAHKRLTQAAAADRSSTPRRKSGPHFSAASRGERLAGFGPLEWLGEGLVEVGNELLDPHLEVLLGGETTPP
jgi:hypothetical protein